MIWRALSTSRLISAADAATAGCAVIAVTVKASVIASRPAPSRVLRIVRSAGVTGWGLKWSRSLDERNLPAEFVVHQRPHLVLDLVETGDLDGGQHLLESRHVRSQQRDVTG